MGRNRFKPFKRQFALSMTAVVALFVASCETVRKPEEVPPHQESALDCRAKLSRETTYNGSILGVQVWITGGAQGISLEQVQVVGRFNEREFRFFPLSQTSNVQADPRFGALVAVPYLMTEDAEFKKKKIQDLAIECRVGSWKKELTPNFQVTEGPYGFEVLHDLPKDRIKAMSKEDQDRVAREQKELKEIYARETLDRLWKGMFLPPIKIPPLQVQGIHFKDVLKELERNEGGKKKWVSSTFGKKRMLRAKGAKKLKFKSFHSGLDLRAQTPVPVIAPAVGKVVLAKDLFYTGNTVALDHGYGLVTLYAHLSEFRVKVGDQVTEGQVVGLSGSTGRVTGPHLHWQAMLYGERVNPVDLFELTEMLAGASSEARQATLKKM